MKQKYTLSIADVELNVTVDESPETVEYIVGVIDRKMREILLKSKYCPKTTAALLCALDLCADKVKAKEEIESLRDELASLEERIKKEEEKNRRAEGLTVALEKDNASHLKITDGGLGVLPGGVAFHAGHQKLSHLLSCGHGGKLLGNGIRFGRRRNRFGRWRSGRGG